MEENISLLGHNSADCNQHNHKIKVEPRCEKPIDCVAAVVLAVSRIQMQFHMCFLVNPGGTTAMYSKVHTRTLIDINKTWWQAWQY